MDILDNIKQNFKKGDVNIKLIYINSALFLTINIITLIFALYTRDSAFILNYVAAPSNLAELATHFWTPITYMFSHQNVFHFFFNMLTLFWFGKIFLMYFSEKQFVGIYIIGGLIGFLFYLVAYNIFPLFQTILQHSSLIGASGSIMAIIIATAMRNPNMELRMLLIGNVKLKYIAIFFILTSLFSVSGENAGGQFAHLGGALAGYLFVVSLRKGHDFTKPISAILDTFANLFGPKKLRIKKNPYKQKGRVMNDGDFNAEKARRVAEIDKILDKIKSSGYESLTTEEKRRLFEQGNKRG